MKYFSDSHFHAMTMKEPNFASFINSFYTSPGELITANATENYIFTPKLLKGNNLLNTIENTLQAFTHPIGETFCMMEDDLAGKYRRSEMRNYEPALPFIREGKLWIKGVAYDKMLMTPLLMDFSESSDNENRVYYTIKEEDKLTPYAEATIEGMEHYYKNHPDGLFEFYPFIGVNPKLHSMEFIRNLLEKYVNTSHLFHAPHVVPDKPFYGIKIYPPLDFNPWPEDLKTLEKHRYIYDFCQRNTIPIITHCDDQGFRGIPASAAWKYTDPESWKTVLENYPKLKIDFAHFGRQYSLSSANHLKTIQSKFKKDVFNPWTNTILSLFPEFDGVYADLSFTGASPDFYEKLSNHLAKVDAKERDTIVSRILFGSDFSVNLLKVESYTEYYSIYENSIFTSEMTERIAANSIEFLGLEEPAPVLSWGKRIRALKKP